MSLIFIFYFLFSFIGVEREVKSFLIQFQADVALGDA